MEILLPLVTFFVALISSVLSGMAGGGGGFIVAPYWLLAGLTPAQGATTGAFMALGMGGGSLAAFRGSEYITKNKRFIVPFLILTAVTSLVGPFFLNQISADAFKPILAVLTLVSLPFLFISRYDIKLGMRNRTIGWVLLGLILLASSFITSSAFSILIAAILLQLFGLNVLEGTAIRRAMGIIQSLVIFIILAALGNFVWQHALAGILGGIAGSYIGTRIAIKKGEKFAKYALAIGAVVSVVALIY